MTENQKLREALQRYGKHDRNCGVNNPRFNCACNCGLEAALAMPTAAPAGEREEFEQFAQNCPMGKYNVTRRGEGYDSSHTQIMWDAWQSGRTALRAGDAVDARQRAVHSSISRALQEAGIRNEVLVGMCIEVGLETYDAAMRKGQL